MSDLTASEVDALLDALRARASASPDDGGALTVMEIAREMKVHPDVARERVKELLADGRMECVRVKRQRMDLVWQMTPAYRLKG